MGTAGQPVPVRLVVLTLALQGRLKVGLDIEQTCQGVVTHTRSMQQVQKPVRTPAPHLYPYCTV